MDKSNIPDAEAVNMNGSEKAEDICTGIPIHSLNQLPRPSGVQTNVIVEDLTDGPDWSTGLFDCFTDKYNMLDVCICSYCNLSMQANLAYNGESGIHWPLCLCLGGLDLCCFGGLAFITVGIMVRQKTRQRYHLKQNFSEMVLDMGTGLCCQLCGLCQQHREMVRHDEWPGCVLLGEPPRQHVEIV